MHRHLRRNPAPDSRCGPAHAETAAAWTRENRPRCPDPDRPPTRREQITRIMTSEPRHDWSGRELADRLHIHPRNMLTQLAEWARLGFLAKTGPGRYALPGPCGPPAMTATGEPVTQT